MAQRGIYLSNQKKKLTHDDVERKIFKYLLYNLNGATQTQLSNELKTPRGQIIDRPNKLLDEKYRYNKRTYRIIKTNYVYSILQEKETTQGLSADATPKQKQKFENRVEVAVQNLSQNDILTDSPAEVIDDKIVYCKVNPKKKYDFKAIILELYNQDIEDIAIGEKGICIILKECPDDSNKLNNIRDNILKLHSESLKRRKRPRKRKKGIDE